MVRFALVLFRFLAVFPVSALAAQTGAFADGELLVRVPTLAGDDGILRVDPSTGQTAFLIEELNTSPSDGGWFVYDPFRDAVLAYTAIQALGINSPRLLRIASDGSWTEMGFAGDKVRSMAPVGDGRVYLRIDGVLHVMFGDDSVVPVLDAGGAAIDLSLDTIVYDPPTESLITASRSDTTPGCGGPGIIAVHRLTLAPGGAQLSAPIECSVYDVDINPPLYPVGLDHLPGGTVLLTVTGGFSFTDDHLFAIDPTTLDISLWAETDSSALDGGVWCAALGAAVVLEDVENELRAFPQGSSGAGILVPTTYPVGDSTTGNSTDTWLTDIDWLGPGCGGLARRFGDGLAGTGGVVPTLSALNCPMIGDSLGLRIAGGVGAGTGLTLFGLGTATISLLGGALYVAPPLAAMITTPLGGAAGAPGAGSTEYAIPVPPLAVLTSVPVFAQTLVADAGAPFGASFTAGLELRME